ncbi:hypothetical protein ABZW32_19240 [Streptomyces sp. NPDC004667]|uniref:hypothetical protein n=1 Tax=Streptomyces sp. NPDC004667 TaxID=3154285 RepID=UPI0033B29FFD
MQFGDRGTELARGIQQHPFGPVDRLVPTLLSQLVKIQTGGQHALQRAVVQGFGEIPTVPVDEGGSGREHGRPPMREPDDAPCPGLLDVGDEHRTHADEGDGDRVSHGQPDVRGGVEMTQEGGGEVEDGGDGRARVMAGFSTFSGNEAGGEA